MQKSIIQEGCESLSIIFEENKKLLAIAGKLIEQGQFEDSQKISEFVNLSKNKAGQLLDFFNQKSLLLK